MGFSLLIYFVLSLLKSEQITNRALYILLTYENRVKKQKKKTNESTIKHQNCINAIIFALILCILII